MSLFLLVCVGCALDVKAPDIIQGMRHDMTIREEKGTLTVRYDGTRLAKLFLVLSAICIIVLIYDALLGAGGAVAGLSVVSATGFLTGLLLYERSQFAFDSRSQSLTWRHRWGWSQQAGVMPFARVKDVLVQSPVGDDGVPSRRLCLRVLEGSDLPLTHRYATDARDELLHLAGRIRTFLRPSAESDASAAVAALVRAGHKMQAVHLLRQTRGLSLNEAIRLITQIKDR